MWTKRVVTYVISVLTLCTFTNAQCPYKFLPYNDSNCYYMTYHLATYEDALTICGMMNSTMYMPGTDLKQNEQMGLWFRQYTIVDSWVPIKRIVTNYTHGQGYWINDQTGENLTYWLWDYAWKTDPKYEDYHFWKQIGAQFIDKGIQGDILKYFNYKMRLPEETPLFNLKITEKDRGGEGVKSGHKEFGASVCKILRLFLKKFRNNLIKICTFQMLISQN